MAFSTVAILPAGASGGPAPGTRQLDRAPAPQNVGQWTLPFEKDASAEGAQPSAAEMAVLGDGRVLYFDGIESTPNAQGPVAVVAGPVEESHGQLLDLRTGTPQWASPRDDTDLFCTDITALPDGRLLMAGGLDVEGLPETRLFDPGTDAFKPAARMHRGRWFPHLAAGPDGNPTVFGGVTQLVSGPQAGEVRRTETYHPDSDSWEENYAGEESETTLPLQPRIVLAPNGQFFYAAAGQTSGPFGHAADEAKTALFQFYDPKTRKWSVSGLAPYGARSGAFVVPLTLEPPFDKMTLLTAGGVLGLSPGAALPANPITALATIDVNGNVTNRNGGDLRQARSLASAVLLPDGKVLAVGGTDREDSLHPGTAKPVLVPELYDPATDQWREMAPHERGRGYHGSALLLPDMRVLLGGAEGDPSLEIWSPPYLFRGARPMIARVQRGVSHGETFTITTPDAGLIESVVLLRTPSPEHGNDSDQRALKLEFTRSGASTLTATAPPSGNVAPPGTYYLVVNKRSLQGPIPSVARMVGVSRSDLADAPQPFPTDAPAPSGGSAANPSSDPPVPLPPVRPPNRRWLFAAR